MANCVNKCPPERTCRNRFLQVRCAAPKEPCETKCVCKPGLLRNTIGECITEQRCGRYHSSYLFLDLKLSCVGSSFPPGILLCAGLLKIKAHVCHTCSSQQSRKAPRKHLSDCVMHCFQYYAIFRETHNLLTICFTIVNVAAIFYKWDSIRKITWHMSLYNFPWHASHSMLLHLSFFFLF